MDRKNSWAITLILTAIVPFATGCPDPCEKALAMRDEGDKIQCTIDNAQDIKNFRKQDCADMMVQAALLSDKDDLDHMYKYYCKDDDRRKTMCDPALQIIDEVKLHSNGSSDLMDQIQAACRARQDGGQLGPAGYNNPNSKILSDRLKELSDNIENQMSTNGAFLIGLTCDPGKITKPRECHDTHGTYVGATTFNGNNKSTPPPAAPSTAAPVPAPAPLPGPVTNGAGSGSASSALPSGH